MKTDMKTVTEIPFIGAVDPADIGARYTSRMMNAAAGGPVRFLMHSNGGDIKEGRAVFELMKHYQAHTTGEVFGVAGSMMSLLLMACDHRVIAESGGVYIHKPWAVTVGEQEDHEATARYLAKQKAWAIGVYMERATLPEDELVAMLNEGRLIDAEEAKEWGLVDEILEIERKVTTPVHLEIKSTEIPPQLKHAIEVKEKEHEVKPKKEPKEEPKEEPQESPPEVGEVDGSAVSAFMARFTEALEVLTGKAEGKKEDLGQAPASEVTELRAELSVNNDLDKFHGKLEPASIDAMKPAMMAAKRAQLSEAKGAAEEYENLLGVCGQLAATKEGLTAPKGLAGEEYDAAAEVAQVAGGDGEAVMQSTGISQERARELQAKYQF